MKRNYSAYRREEEKRQDQFRKKLVTNQGQVVSKAFEQKTNEDSKI